jgi:hypothetical protein
MPLTRIGRPPLSRDVAFQQIERLPRRGRYLILVNARQMSRTLDCHRCTIGVILDDLERADRLRRCKRKGKRGLLIELTTRPDSDSAPS